jgi:hypothetical protein
MTVGPEDRAVQVAARHGAGWDGHRGGVQPRSRRRPAAKLSSIIRTFSVVVHRRHCAGPDRTVTVMAFEFVAVWVGGR